MKKSADIWEQKKREFFSKRFSELLDGWKKNEKRQGRAGTQEAFAEKLNCSINSITRYKSGTDYPNDIGAVAKAFGVPEEVFYPILDFERGGDPAYHTEVEGKLQSYCDSIGLDNSLVSFVTSEASLRSEFPLFRRAPLPFVKEIGLVKTDSPYQVEDENGNAHFLSSRDLDCLRELQDELIDFIRFKIYEKKQAIRKQNQVESIELITSHTDVTRDQLLAKCQFRITSSVLDETIREDTNTINRAFASVAKERGQHIVWHWKRSEIEDMFQSEVDPSIHRANIAWGKTESELAEFYQQCAEEEQVQKEEFIQKILENGDVIDDG